MVSESIKVSGFTLIEVIALIAIIGILAIVALPTWQGSNINFVTQSNQIVGDIRYAQALSMASNQRYRFVITSSNSYQITNAAGTAVIMPMGGTSTVFSAGVTFGSVTNLPNNLIAFGSDGTPYVTTAAPETALTATATIPVIHGSSTRTISISPNTGRVVIQ